MPEPPVTIDPADWVCPLPLRETKRIVLGHGGGGVLSMCSTSSTRSRSTPLSSSVA